jgi:transposase-like protein
MEQTMKCPICGDPYKVYAFYAGDQSACPDCQRKANEKRGKWKVSQ